MEKRCSPKNVFMNVCMQVDIVLRKDDDDRLVRSFLLPLKDI